MLSLLILPAALQAVSADLLHPLALGCETRGARIVQICLGCMQRLITHGALSVPAGATVVRTLWSLMEGGIEELKLLQTIIILLTTNSIVQGDSLAMALVMCFRLHFTKDSTTINTASATVRQMVTLVFERVEAEDKTPAP
ncbi:PREDICTED: protein MON2 homolog, partial [Priapulus caudatus]|uniref:Protein MON2 homolog n=1 Tax=Priapulus caudatus TaxID=37621 RepID=A0ABM1F775_PRICU